MARIRESVEERFLRMQRTENKLYAEGRLYVAGVDEVGRGPLAGPVYAAAVILDPTKPILGLNDSKKLSEKKRLELYETILQEAIGYAITWEDPSVIDTINILEATKRAMTRAIQVLNPTPDFLLLDALHLEAFPMDTQQAVVKGDSNVNCIAAASILAKVSRDKLMAEYDLMYPGYYFSQHKGYGTRMHYEALEKLGPSPIHRKSFLRKWEANRTGDTYV